MEHAVRLALEAFLAPRNDEKVRAWRCRGRASTTVGVRYLEGTFAGAEVVIAYPGRAGALDFTSEYGEQVSNKYVVASIMGD